MEDLLNNLNNFLCDLNVFYRKLQNYHWNIKGTSFFVIHSKLEEYYDDINDQIDEIAEHILSIGGQPLGKLEDYLKSSKILASSNQKITKDAVLNSICKDYSTLLTDSINIKKLADENSEFKTSALMDSFIEDYGKKIWMIKQSLE